MDRFTLDRCPSHCERLTECYRRPPAPSSPGFHHVVSELVSIGHRSRSLSKEAGGEGSRSHGKDKNTAFVAKPAQNTGANPAHPCRPYREHPKSPDSPNRPLMHRRLQIIVSKTPYRNREYANMRGEPCSYRHAQSILFGRRRQMEKTGGIVYRNPKNKLCRPREIEIVVPSLSPWWGSWVSGSCSPTAPGRSLEGIRRMASGYGED